MPGRDILAATMTAAIYFAAAVLGLAVALEAGGITPVWPANAIVVALLLRADRRSWPYYFAAVPPACAFANWLFGIPLISAIAFSGSVLCEIGLAAYLLRRWFGERFALADTQQLIAFLAVAAIFAPALAAILGAGVAVLTYSNLSFGAAYWNWWIGGAMGALLVGPALITATPTALRRCLGRVAAIERAGVVVATLLVGIVAFQQPAVAGLFLVVPLLLWSAMRLGAFETAWVGLLVTAVAVSNTVFGFGPLAGAAGAAPTTFYSLQIFLASLVLPALTAAVLREERTHAELQVKRTSATLEAIDERMAGAIFSLQRDAHGNDQFSYVSPSTISLFGLRQQALYANARALSDAIHPADRAEFNASLQHAVESLVPWSSEFRVGSGTDLRWIRGSAVPQRQEDGTTMLRGLFIDATELRQREADLKQSERRVRGIMDGAVDGIVLIDERGTIQSINPAGARMFGYTADELIGSGVARLMPERHRSRHGEYIASYLATGMAKIIGIGREVESVRKDGTLFPMELAVGEIRSNGDQRQFVGTMRDLTEWRLTEERLRRSQKLEAVGQLTGGLAHDFNNLLSVIIGNVELIEVRLVGQPELRPLLAATLRAAERGAALTRRLLVFSRKQELSPVALDVNALVDGMIDMLRRTLGETIAVRTELAERLWNTRVDPGELENALLNLAVNARDAMPSGGDLVIRTANFLLEDPTQIGEDGVTSGPYVTVTVGDTGSGMPPEVLAHVFEPFFTTKPIGRGSGLGLAMVYGFAKQSGGFVTIKSNPHEGTSVTIALPQGAARAAGETVAPRAATASRGAGEKILVVEDDAAVREIVLAQLKALGYVVREAADAQTAMTIIETEPDIDAVLTDTVLPSGMSGIDLISQIRNLRPEIGIIRMSGYSAEAAPEPTGADQAIPVLRKPFRTSDLAAGIRSALSNAHRPRDR